MQSMHFSIWALTISRPIWEVFYEGINDVATLWRDPKIEVPTADVICICSGRLYVLCRQQCKVTWGMFLTNFSLLLNRDWPKKQNSRVEIAIFEFTVSLHIIPQQLFYSLFYWLYFFETWTWWLQFCSSQLSIKLEKNLEEKKSWRI